jgi:hypothetical protein
MLRIITIATAISALSGCASMGFFDDHAFVNALNAKQCNEARQLLGYPVYWGKSRGAEFTFRGMYEIDCGDRKKGQELVTTGAEYGDSYARKVLIHYGMPLPDPRIPISGGGGGETLDIYIHKGY